MIKIVNKTNRIKYFDVTTQNLKDDITDIITVEAIRKSNLASHLKNINNYFLRPDKYSPIIENIFPIPKKSSWFFDGKTFANAHRNKLNPDFTPSKENLFQRLNTIKNHLSGKKIGVELSGGLDTSIIIGVLRHLGIEPYLVGTYSNNFEFRTEYFIQKKLVENRSPSTYSLIENDGSLVMGKLLETPLHSLPSSTSLYHNFAHKIAEKFKEAETDIVFNGMALDMIFCEKPEDDYNSWDTCMLEDNWFNQYIYQPLGMEYSALGMQTLLDYICALRKGESEDPKKIWARDFFKEFIPVELSDYNYKADNSGIFIQSIWNAENEIKEIFRVAFDITKFPEFSANKVEDLFANLQHSTEEKDKKIFAYTSYANWIYALAKNSMI